MARKIDTVFVLALITLFAATSFILVLIGAKQYRFVTDVMDENYKSRTTSSYLMEKIRQNDSHNAITISDLEGVSALTLTTSEEDIRYITYIFYNLISCFRRHLRSVFSVNFISIILSWIMACG